MADTGDIENKDVGPSVGSGNSPVIEVALERERQQKIVAWCKDRFQKMKNDRITYEQQWQLNMAFYSGNQNVVLRKMGSINVVQGQGALMTPPAPKWAARPIINRIRPTIRTELAKLTAQKPSAFVIPASSEDRDQYAAQAGEQIWETTYRDKQVDVVTRDSVFWTVICGTGFMKAYWDPTKEDFANDQKGDFCYEAEAPWNVYVPNLKESSLENQPYIFHAMKKSKDYAKLAFPGVDPKSNTSSSEPQIMSIDGLGNDGASTKEQNEVLVMEVWIKPRTTPEFPNGALLTIVGDRLVQEVPQWPYKLVEYPFAKIDHIPTGMFYGESSIKDLIPLQREYNRTRGQIIEAKNRMAKPQLLAEKGSIDPTRITTEPGQIILYEPGATPPVPLQLQSLPNYVLQELERIQQDWADISGIHEVSNGTVPPGVSAATAISYLQEQDETKLSHTVFSIEHAIQKIAKLTLNYVHEFWTSERALKVIGLDGSFDFLAFKGSDLRGNTDIQIEAGSALPNSRAAKQAFLMDLYDRGAIPEEQLLDMLDMGGINRLRERVMVDRKQAQRENLKMARVTQDIMQQHLDTSNQKAFEQGYVPGPEGLPADPITGEIKPPELVIPVNTYDNHMVHIEEHNNYRKSQAFENLSDEVKALFDQHVEQHLDMIGAMQAGMQPPMPPGAGLPPTAMPTEESIPMEEGNGTESA